MGKFFNIDPDTCSIEELKDAIATCNGKKEYYGALEQGCKKFINSVYGAVGSAYYVCANMAIAESVTLQGQDLIKYSAKKVNHLVGKVWPNINELVKPEMYILDKNTLDIVGVIRYDLSLEQIEDWKNFILNHPNDFCVYLSKETIGIGYKSLLSQICKIEEGTKRKYLDVNCSNLGKNYCENKKINIIDREDDGVVFDANPVSFIFIFEHLNIYRRIGYELLKQSTDFDFDTFVENCKIPITFPESTRKIGDNGEIIDTLQCYGDSCSGDTVVMYDDSGSIYMRLKEIEIKDLFEKYIDTVVEVHGKEYVTPSNDCYVQNFNGSQITNNRVAHIVRHKTNKQMYLITSATGKSVKITEDHSLVMYDMKTGTLSDVCPKDIDDTLRLIVVGDNINLEIVKSVEKVDTEEYVYDIEMSSIELNRHNFFGNGILLHNTDSVSKNSIIRTKKHPDGITIEEFYNENKDNFAGNTVAGHESVATLDEVLNWVNGLYYSKVERIIRHKVSKPKWRLTVGDGRSVECTADHSLIKIDDYNRQVPIKPTEIKQGDIVKVTNCKMNVKSCECVGSYDDEYVYDIEMDDDTHTFFANDILVHNSAYITLQPLIESCGVPAELATYFILAFNEHVMEDYLSMQFDVYAKKFNCPKNLENFELEKIARSILLQKKKKYVMDIAWTDSHIFYDPLKKLVFKGVEAVKGESSQFIRKEQKEFVKWIIDNINKGKELKYPEIVGHIMDIKKRFMMASPDDICVTKSLSDYDKYILNDKGSRVVYAEDVVIPYHAKASSWYNNLLYTKEKNYRSKYDFIRKGDKVRIYYVENPIDDEHKTFAFLPGNYPVEFAPPMDMNEMFSKLMLDPLNRYIEALGYNPIGSKLTYKTSLF